MAEVYVVEVPGGERQAWQCPYCSRMYPMQDDEARTLECPSACRRCGSPMDVDKSQAFQDAQAAKQDRTVNRRQTVKV